ncbi:MAG: PA0069 family radical SAM protein [Pseudomonadota bacterium]|nr:MAG: PA0069 family radical SAM protein [Pseudomonadota bacterium]
MKNRHRTSTPHRGRGATANPTCRFNANEREAVDDGWQRDDEDAPPLRTTVTIDATRSIIARNDSPDVPFAQSINPYRGCEHGCVYCFARPTHAYLGLSPGLDFESRLLVKPDAARLLRTELARPSYRCRPIALGTNTDPYQPIERHHRLVRDILEVLWEHRHPVSIVTKSALVERDLDVLGEMAGAGLAQVMISVTTLDRTLARRLEPRAAAPQRRLQTIERIAAAGVPVGVLVAPVIPVLTEPELETILQACAAVGANSAGYILLRLPLEVRGLFADWLRVHVPLTADHVMSRMRDTRGGREYDNGFFSRMTGSGDSAQLIAQRFSLACKRHGLDGPRGTLNTDAFRVPLRSGTQLNLL